MSIDRHRGSGSPEVLLVSMPFALSRSPAIGISLLKAILERAGIGVDLRYLNLEFADRIGHMLHNT
ncbi:MAG: hypothetical protein KJO98_06685, partial [Rhodothermia bacterium]|nr:hypothetical protein [Rhodothermia bacterium]